MNNEFNNKVILITGASSGLGFNLAKFFLNKGAKIVSISRRKKNLITKNNKLKNISFDLTNFKNYEALFKKIPNLFGSIDYFIHAAGVHFIKPIRFISSRDIDKALSINLKSPILISKYFQDKKIFKRPCSVVFIASVMAIVGSSGLSIYSASKSGLVGFTKSLSIELSKQMIRVNCISPGIVKSPLYRDYSKQLTDEMNKKIVENHPLGLGTFSDVNNSICFLLSSESKWITGHNLIIDGGYSVL